ncbi:MAG: metal ABC transporter solute-binding protein, Zn/Mn family, partial [Shewanella sp.]
MRINSKLLRCLGVGCMLTYTGMAHAELNVFACEPEYAALAKALAPTATIYAATTALQDPHQVQARPSLIAKMRQADLVVCAGADLEVGWLPMLQM